MRTSTIAAALAAAVLLACGARAQERPPTLEERVAALEVELQMLTQRVEGRGSVAPSSCGGKLRVIASIEDSAVIERILEHLGRDAAPVDAAHPSRAPPQGDLLL